MWCSSIKKRDHNYVIPTTKFNETKEISLSMLSRNTYSFTTSFTTLRRSLARSVL